MSDEIPTIPIDVQGTRPQAKFWRSLAKAKAFVAGIGAGKTWAGAIEVFRQPEETVGMVLAPTYPMLRDATLRTFLDLANRLDLLAEFRRGEMRAELTNGTTVLFRTASDPDRLRGPNLGWFWIDEAPLVARDVWLVMIGRLREWPGRCWLTMTPRGKDWVYREFTSGIAGRELIRAPSRSNPYLPPDYVTGLEATYRGTFAAQELEGEFIDDQSDALIPGDWLDRCLAAGRGRWAVTGHKRLAIDLGAGTGGDLTVLGVRCDSGIHEVRHSDRWDLKMAARIAAQLRIAHGVEPRRVTWDYPGIGIGFGIGFLEPAGIKGATAYVPGASGGSRFANLRTAAAWHLRERLEPDRPAIADFHTATWNPRERLETGQPVTGRLQLPFAIPPQVPTTLRDELAGLRWTVNNERKIALQSKDEFAAELGHSPDYADMLIQSYSHPFD